MVKAYLRYEHELSFGVLSSGCNAVFNRSGRCFLTGILEGIAVWKSRNGELITILSEPVNELHRPVEVKSLCRSPLENLISAGYSDGSIRVWDLNQHHLQATFHGHKRAVTSSSFSTSGKLLATGSQDTTICVWDLISETGLFKLHGHTNEITGIGFLKEEELLVSCSRDGQLKLWELKSQQCWQTLLHDRGVIWSLAVHPYRNEVVVGSVGNELEMYALSEQGETPSLEVKVKLKRKEDDEAQVLVFSKNGEFLACKNGGNVIEIFQEQSEDQAKEMREKQRKKSEKIVKELAKKAKKGTPLTKKEFKKQSRHEQRLQQEKEENLEVYKFLQVHQTSNKIISIDFRPNEKLKSPLEVGIVFNNNAFEIKSLLDDEEGRGRRISVHHRGHRSGIRSLSLSSDDELFLSLSEREMKIWKSENGNCIHSLPSGYGLSGLFAPGDSIIVIGTKAGKLEIYDLHSSSFLESIEAHSGPIWSVISLPNQSGFISGGADCTVKFWSWGLKTSSAEAGKKKQVCIKQVIDRQLTVESDILSMKISPDGRILSLALLDTTIRLFHLDKLSVYLTLYGHKLPVLTVDISADNELLISGSADKNIKIWGMDFGDCHKSLFGHNDSITQVAFVHTTHYFFSVGKDKMVKYWDADKFQLLLELPGHHAEVWCLAVSREGDFLFTGSNDRSLRKWKRTEEPFFLEEEKEKRREQLFDQDLLEEDSKQGIEFQEEQKDKFGVAGQKTVSSLNAADSLIEALELTSLELKKDEKQPSNPLLLGLDPEVFVLRAIQNIKSTDMEMALLSISFSDALVLLKYLAYWLRKGTSQIEMLCKVTLMLIRVHQPQLATSMQARPLLLDVQGTLRPHLTQLRDTVGFNLEAIKLVRSLCVRGGGNGRTEM